MIRYRGSPMGGVDLARCAYTGVEPCQAYLRERMEPTFHYFNFIIIFPFSTSYI
jgi:hypothetical protein